MKDSEVRELLAEYYQWLTDNPEWQDAPLWAVPLPRHLWPVAVAEWEARFIHGDPLSDNRPRGLTNG